MATDFVHIERTLTRKASHHLRTFRRQVTDRFPGKISDVVLFGSRARGDARRDSDYDIAVFVHDLVSSRKINHELAGIAYQHLLKGVHIRPFALPSDFLETNGRRGIALAITREGVSIP